MNNALYYLSKSKVKVTRLINARVADDVVNVKPFNRCHRGRGHTVSATQLVSVALN